MRIKNVMAASLMAAAIVASSDTVRAQNTPELINSQGRFVYSNGAKEELILFDAEDIERLDIRIKSVNSKIERVKQQL